jgi:HEAT repeat protein
VSRDRSKDAPKTADELMAELERDPEYRARMDQGERERLTRIAESRRDAAPVVADLVRAGFQVEVLDELLDKKLDYQRAVSILLSWLPKVSNPDVKESIVRVLSVPLAKPAARLFVDEFRRAAPDQSALKWAIGNGLEVVADDAVFEDLVEIVRDPKHGKAREMVAAALGNMRNPRAVDVLIGLLEDEEIAGHAIMGLGKLKARAARAAIERFLDHPKSWVRQEAKKAIAKIDKAGARRH